MLAVLLMLGVGVHAAGFADTRGHWAESAIDRWSGLGVITGGGGLFRPDDPITRGELAVILDRILEYRDAACVEFSDLGQAFFTDAVGKAAAQGVLQGSGGMVRPYDSVTRQEAAVILARAFGVGAIDSPATFLDAQGIAPWAAGAVAAMEARGYVSGSGGYFYPASPVTRAEIVKILDQMVGEVYTEARLLSQGMVVAGGEHPGSLVLCRSAIITDTRIGGNLILSPGIGEEVVLLHNVTVEGVVLNLGGAQVYQSGSTALQVEEVSAPAPRPPYVTPEQDYLDYYGRPIAVEPGVPRCTLDPAGFSTENGIPAYTAPGGARARLGVDVSAWQEDVDWAAVRAAGVEFAMLRVGARGYTSGEIRKDAWFEANIRGAQENGIEVGVYFFSQATSVAEAEEEAAFVLDAISGHTITYPVCFDWEWIGGDDARTDAVSGGTATACAKAFCDRVAAAGYRPSVYLYTETALLLYSLADLAEYDFWFAKYRDTPDFYYDIHMWQFTSSGTVPGIKGRADMNLCFR